MTDLNYRAVDYFTDESLIADPAPYFTDLRSRCPVLREPHHDVVMVTGYEEASAILLDRKTMSSCNALSGPFPGIPVPPGSEDVSELIEAYRDRLPMHGEITTMDVPRHTAYRALLAPFFTPKQIRETEPFMRGLADRLIDDIIDQGECELIAEFSGRFSLLNVCALLGVPESDHQIFIDEIVHQRPTVGSVTVEMPADPFAFLHERFGAYLDERRAQPRDDLMTSLITTPFPDGSMPSESDTVRLASILFIAGITSTAHLIAAALRALCEIPDLQELLRAEPDRIPDFIEETLRLEGSVNGMFRLSRTPKTVGGVDIPAGTTLMLAVTAVNRDPRMFEDPDEFRLDRPNVRQHIAFGRGNHVCVGAPLARAEGRIAVERLLARLSDIRISERFHGPVDARVYKNVPSYIARGMRRLHLEFTPAD